MNNCLIFLSITFSKIHKYFIKKHIYKLRCIHCLFHSVLIMDVIYLFFENFQEKLHLMKSCIKLQNLDTDKRSLGAYDITII